MASSTAPAPSPTRSNRAVPQQPRKKNHPFIISGLFDIISKIDTEVNGQYGFRECMTTIATINLDTDEVLECAIKGSAYGGIDTVLESGSIYSLKGRLLALNKKQVQIFYYEPDTTIHVSTSDSFKSNLTNKALVTGLGLIISRDVEKITPEKENVTIVMRHSDFNPSPSVRDQETFEVEYRCNWSPLMVKLQPLLIPHREALLTGRIIGFSPSRNIWSVEVTGVNITTGHENGAVSSLPAAGSQLGTPGGRVRGKLFIPGGEGDESTVQSTATPTKGKGRAATASAAPRQSNKKARTNGNIEDALIDP
ncbi:hypothetical protein DFH28DRAFT_1127198 [Melampsora americana]|nr:hypothetical protein DFH28DRAFT_1127198 [Melampsora americana]